MLETGAQSESEHNDVEVHFSHAGVMGVTFCDCVDAYYRKTLQMPEGWTTGMYSRTQNENGTFNTRCLYCLLTVATSVESEEDLEGLELFHMCPEKALAELVAGKAAVEAHAHRN